MLGNLNLQQTKAGPMTVTTSGLAQLMGNTDRALQNVGKGFTQTGEALDKIDRQNNTSNMTDLIAKSQMEGLTADGIRSLVNEGGVDTSRLSKDGTDAFSALIGGKDAFAKQGTGIINKDGSFTDLTDKQGAVPEVARGEEFYSKFKSGDKTFDRSLEGTTLENKQTLIDGYLKGNLRAKELFNDYQGKKTSKGFVYQYQGRPVTAVELKQKMQEQQAVVDNPAETPLKKEKAQKELDSIEGQVQQSSEQTQKEEGAINELLPSTRTRDDSIIGDTSSGKANSRTAIEEANGKHLQSLLAKDPTNQGLKDLIQGVEFNTVENTIDPETGLSMSVEQEEDNDDGQITPPNHFSAGDSYTDTLAKLEGDKNHTDHLGIKTNAYGVVNDSKAHPSATRRNNKVAEGLGIDLKTATPGQSKEVAREIVNRIETKLQKTVPNWDTLSKNSQEFIIDAKFNTGDTFKNLPKALEKFQDNPNKETLKAVGASARRKAGGKHTKGMDNRVAKIMIKQGLIKTYEDARNAGLPLARKPK